MTVQAGSMMQVCRLEALAKAFLKALGMDVRQLKDTCQQKPKHLASKESSDYGLEAGDIQWAARCLMRR
jgi:hypothetical protein